MKTFATDNRSKWREYLEKHFKTDSEIWFVFPTKASGETSLSYNDAVEEALCFGWIDSTAKRLDDTHQLRRFSPRRPGSPYSQPNVERLKWLDKHDLIHPDIKNEVLPIIQADFTFPKDIIATIKKDKEAWKNYQSFSEPYKRIRVAYIDAARKRPDEFKKRLDNFITKTRQGKLIVGYGGVDKYYTIED